MAQAVLCHNCGTNLKSAQNYRKELLSARQRAQKEREQAFKEKERRQNEEKLVGLISSLNYPSEQKFAIYQLRNLGEAAVTPLLKALFEKHKPNTRFAAAIALGQLGSTIELKALVRARIIKALIKALADPEPAIRERAAEALGNFGSQAAQVAVEPLGAALKDRNEQVRQQAWTSLEKIGGERAQELLRRSGGFMGWLKRG
jgi:HEAT repeat protein